MLDGNIQPRPIVRARHARTASVPVAWIVVVAAALLLPWLFYDWRTGHHAGFVVSILSQMGIMVIFALSYNMLMGQAGLLSFGHAVFFGLGGYAAAHLLNAIGAGILPVPIELLPLLSGGAGLLAAVVFGYMATRQRTMAFAMITLGIGELITSAAMMFHSFFGGEAGVTTDRMVDHSLFGLSYAQGIQVYYLIIAWVVIAAAAMALLTRTPLGRLANACRDNHERAQFMGYDPRVVRFLQFALAGGFAGIAGGLFAITYEIVTFDAVSATLSANALLMAYIGGATAFGGPILGAILITLLQSGVSLLSNAWLIYVGTLFILMVTCAPDGLAGIVLAHAPLARAGKLRRLAAPYCRIAAPGVLTLAGFVGLVELASFATIGAAQGGRLAPFGHDIDTGSPLPWLVAAASLLAGGAWLWFAAAGFRASWETLSGELAGADA